MNGNGNYTIKEIAELAGVSRATVDRVIHGRGVVSPETAEKIKSMLAQIDYKPNILAQSLKKGALLRIAILVPDPDVDVYWKRAVNGLDEAIAEYHFIGIHIEKYLFNPHKPQSFVLNAKYIIDGDYQGVIIAPFFNMESLAFLKECEQRELPYVTFNNHISECRPLCFVGQELFESGKTAAALLDRITPAEKGILVLHLDEDLANARHMQEKEGGFLFYFRQNGKQQRTVKVHKIDQISQLDRQMGKILEEDGNVGGIFVSTSKVHYVADYLEAYSLDVKLVGYDLIPENMTQLEAGHIDSLIFQNPRLQANQALKALVDSLAFKKEVPARYILPAEIVIKENLGSYIPGLNNLYA